ncbi:hypothetical protein MKW98_021594 [Papaver atlanticum]|uniref:Serine-threonine/tyrosine-protein kinase catalytic domain-containing protein n=1 Tax=Papaver atlanticum TaxID=357466 RepID=A0AAD4TCE1_9MAGN|nr:hypothetical protein MKW98_021594 [Papaver atlanticum]
MPMFRFFSCVRSSNVYSSHSERRHGCVLGEGRLGRVYKGILKDGQEVAVKRFYEQADLWAEIQMLSLLEHFNIVKMIGYCDKGKDHIIVYEFMPLRSFHMVILVETVMTGSITPKSDVYSFGVVLLELISGQKVIDATSKRNIVAWARPLLSDSKNFPEIADPLMEGQYPYRGLVQALNLAKLCLQEDSHKRPLTAEVVTTLSNLVSQVYEGAQGTTEADPFTPPTMERRAQAVA